MPVVVVLMLAESSLMRLEPLRLLLSLKLLKSEFDLVLSSSRRRARLGFVLV